MNISDPQQTKLPLYHHIEDLRDACHWIELRKIDEQINAHRHYCLGWQPTLFGSAVVRRLGRIGSYSRTLQPLFFDCLDDAWPTMRSIIQKRFENGYFIVEQ